MIHDQINQDLKKALLGGDSFKATVLRGLKSAIGYAEVAAGKRDKGLSDDEVIALFQKEAKKRQESADMYAKADDKDRSDQELKEKAIISEYLPAELSEEDIAKIVSAVVEEMGATTMASMGQVVGAVKAQAKGAADGAVIARLVKERLQ